MPYSVLKCVRPNIRPMMPVTSGTTPSHRSPIAAAKTSVVVALTGTTRNAAMMTRAQQVDEREQVLLAVARAEQTEDIGADRVEQVRSARAPSRPRPAPRRTARGTTANAYVMNTSWKPQAKKASVMNEIAAMRERLVHCVAQAAADRRRALSEGHLGPDRQREQHHRACDARRTPASPSASPNAVDQPLAQRRDHHRPERAQLLPRVRRSGVRRSGGAARDTVPMSTPKPVPAIPMPIRTPAICRPAGMSPAKSISSETRGEGEGSARSRPGVRRDGRRARPRTVAGDAPHEVLQRDGEPEASGRNAEPGDHGLHEEAEALSAGRARSR